MAIYGGVLSVTTTPMQVDGNFRAWSHIHIRNNDNTKTLYIGGADLTAGNGLMINGLETVDFDIPPSESFFVVTSSGTAQVSWLRIDKD